MNGTLQNFDFSSFLHLLCLDLQRNNLGGTIPSNIGMLSNLSTNSLNGFLPLSLANFTQLGGQIPKDIGNLKFLVSLVADTNHFNGPLPPSLRNLINLQALRVSMNQVSGSIHAT
ncbi:hypothetical protein FEM48_Zijuj03G0135200 [Ziziphus jujuba var. spinosa]|uniref:Uncharacterized protein n=1 Tax=Ziziphus jujuba var. spinosa TaxID=714518 RepID=A0A978VQK9_ZIZJJ|nr:hypothetical protein FEM48_Zijuj03G0135200 [Ziziphus jujuba var. spinosa]